MSPEATTVVSILMGAAAVLALAAAWLYLRERAKRREGGNKVRAGLHRVGRVDPHLGPGLDAVLAGGVGPAIGTIGAAELRLSHRTLDSTRSARCLQPYRPMKSTQQPTSSMAGTASATGDGLTADFLRALAKLVPYRVHTVLTDNGTQLTDCTPPAKSWPPAMQPRPDGLCRRHAFDWACEQLGIEQRFTKPAHPGQTGR